MPTIEERVAYLEGRMQDHSALWTELRNGVNDLRADTNRRFEEVRLELADVRADMNRRFDEVRVEIADVRTDMNRQFGGVRTEFSGLRADLDRRFDEARAEARSDNHRLEDKVDRHFVWLTGMLLTSMLGTMGAVVGLYFR